MKHSIIFAVACLTVLSGIDGAQKLNVRRSDRPANYGQSYAGFQGFICVLEDKADKDQCNARIDKLSKDAGCRGRKCRRSFDNVNAIAFMAKNVKAVEDKLDELSQCCKSVEMDRQVQINACRSEITWGLDRIDGNYLQGDYTPTTIGCGATVFVIDTGIRYTHDEFKTSDLGSKVVGGYNAITSTPGVTVASADDDNGHGTHCAGTVAGETYGVATGANLYAIKVLSASGSGTGADVIEGINHVGDVCPSGYFPDGTRCVVSMSLGGGFWQTENNAVATLVNTKNIVVVVAAGNDNDDASNYSPASEPSAITVGSTTSSDQRS